MRPHSLNTVTIRSRTGAFALAAQFARPALPALLALSALSALSTLSACAGIIRHEFGTPVVELKDVRVRGVGMQGGSLDLVLEVYNPNDYRLDASRLTYTLFVDTAAIATGEINKLVTLEKKKTSEVILPVTFTTRELMGAAQALTRTGSLDYTVKGEMTLASPFGNYTRQYEGKGRFDSIRP